MILQRASKTLSTLGRRLRSLQAKHINCAVELSELLGRRPINLDTPELQRFLAGKVVLVTGAGGSIGSEICRQTMKFCPARIILIDRAENALFEIDRELRERWVGADITPVVADICDAKRIDQVFGSMAPQVVFHCAAHKHVPMMEANPGEAVKNNVFGTKIVADAALEHGAAAFVMVSTDKAVNPTSVMGATKRVAELYVQSLNNSRQQAVGSGQQEMKPPAASRQPPATRFLAVRFGNVIGSSGSVVPIFRKQIEAGGPVTITHPDMQRYFMTIPEASQLVMQAGAIGQGGEIFILDMGQPVKILDLATEMVRRAGLVPDRDIEIRVTGIRPGEKLYEELACDNEQTRPTSHKKIHVWQLPQATTQQARRMLDLLGAVIDADRDTVVRTLAWCVPEYRPVAEPVALPQTPGNNEPARTVPADSLSDQATRLRELVRGSTRAA
ncbi:MAG TPA: nucleoside-diphosphate sugar epimerase/dehydratase [Tepidisphaeraceae bacterium]|nr:nucleoside-diphosphate sugar epimerase/dehydratase [Tepidisphaeraceae bacterium]